MSITDAPEQMDIQAEGEANQANAGETSFDINGSKALREMILER